MKWIGIISALAIMAATGPTLALTSQPAMAVGEEHEIIISYETAQHGSDRSSGSSSGQNILLERVIAVGDDGTELEFDLPHDATAQDRASVWEYPVRVLQTPIGALQLLNADELEARIDPWLASAGLSREHCGQLIFTWNAFRIHCDPQSVIADIEMLNLLAFDLREGASYRHPLALAAGDIIRTSNGPSGEILSVTLEIDPDAVRRSRAETDVAVGDLMQQPISLEAALADRAGEEISGQIEVTFNLDPQGRPTRRTVVTMLEILESDGVTQTDTRTEMVERLPISR